MFDVVRGQVVATSGIYAPMLLPTPPPAAAPLPAAAASSLNSTTTAAAAASEEAAAAPLPPAFNATGFALLVFQWSSILDHAVPNFLGDFQITVASAGTTTTPAQAPPPTPFSFFVSGKRGVVRDLGPGPGPARDEGTGRYRRDFAVEVAGAAFRLSVYPSRGYLEGALTTLPRDTILGAQKPNKTPFLALPPRLRQASPLPQFATDRRATTASPFCSVGSHPLGGLRRLRPLRPCEPPPRRLARGARRRGRRES